MWMVNIPSLLKELGGIRVSYIGYKKQEIALANQEVINVVLEPDTEVLDEVVVVGYGSQKKESVVGAISTLDMRKLNVPGASISNVLAGQLSGVVAMSRSGEPGKNSSADFYIRGVSSFKGTSTPLVLVDGIERDLDLVDTDDIATFSILKDASASAVYGVRGANGVILITTKKGKAGKASVSYSGNARYAGPNHLPDLMNSYQFANYFNEGSINGGGKAIFDEDTMERIQQYMNGQITTSTIANANGNWQFHEKANDNVNWYKTHYKWAWSQEHNLNINGGSDKSQYYVSANYLDQDGNLRYGKDSYERISTNAKFNAQPFKWLDIEVNTKYVYTKLDNPLYSDMNGLFYHDVARLWPTMPFKDPNGYYMRNGKLGQLTNGSRSITSNNNVYLQGQLVFHPLKNWNIYANVGLRLIDQVQRQNLNKVYEHNVVGEALELAYGGEYAVGQTGAMQYWTKANHLTTSLYSDYSFSFDEHQFKVMAGVNTEKYNNRYLSVKRIGSHY